MLVKWMMTPQGLVFDRWLVKHAGYSLLSSLFARQTGFKPPGMLLLATTGRRTGKRREVALPCFPHGDGWLIVGSKGGAPTDPAWVHNLRTNPQAEVYIRRRRRAVLAQVTEGDQYQRLWTDLCERVPTYRHYQELAAGHRDIPVVILQPR